MQWVRCSSSKAAQVPVSALLSAHDYVFRILAENAYGKSKPAPKVFTGILDRIRINYCTISVCSFYNNHLLIKLPRKSLPITSSWPK